LLFLRYFVGYVHTEIAVKDKIPVMPDGPRLDSHIIEVCILQLPQYGSLKHTDDTAAMRVT
jgi:hypothetical protein